MRGLVCVCVCSERMSSDPGVYLVPAAAPPAGRSHRGQLFFDYLLVVSLRKRRNKEGYEPHITYQFPKREVMGRLQREEEEKCMKAAHLFCFPEGINWAPLTEYKSETFSFVLTELDGSRRNGYCRRLLVMGRLQREEEEKCMKAAHLFCFPEGINWIFDEVEKRRQISKAMIYPFMQSLREAPLPSPGNTVTVSSFIPDAGTEIISLTRPAESWLEHVDFHTLFRCLSDEEVLMVFAATVMERRIIFISEELSVCLTSETKFITRIGDEECLLPATLKEELLSRLSTRTRHASTEELNRLVSEAFLSVFVRSVGHFSTHFKRSGNSRQFQKKSFLKAVEHKSHLSFVKLFIQTQMFDLFIQEEETQANPNGTNTHFRRKDIES
uniref:DENN/MADD domain containing 2Db n=1 Tax=Cyprinus carpio TaxID=7962 RepID=A0A8C1VXM1_CYPCA